MSAELLNPSAPENLNTPENQTAITQPERLVIVLNQDLPSGKAANAAAVLAMTLGQRHPELIGEPLDIADGKSYPGLIPLGISVLSASEQELTNLMIDGGAKGCDVTIFPADGQQTTHYLEFRQAVAIQTEQQLVLLGVAIAGDKKVVRKLVGKLKLFA
ncbi:DUF2000 domain-containing protein [Serratia sp. M24T3]|uniref:DUF2000 domain-containing protein n=1 Tax=Serratia sp. M24T3 TaxID=932213 RepID=UPI00025B9EEA|nr:DUF2000 domain-containing protein [Serratia sp. M24T3]EIC86086.1 hypothetical Protein SPM24T3_01773 [Serratia sp. M24T3]